MQFHFVGRTSLCLFVASLAAFAGGDDPRTKTAELLKTPAPIADGRPNQLAHLELEACAKCHTAVADEWSKSAHSMAWVDEVYQEELKDKKRPEGCWGCHAPAVLHTGDLSQKPPARDTEREFGIRCESCHAGADGGVLGPFGASTDAHPSTKNPNFVGAGRDALCATCHRTTVGPVIGLAKDFEGAKLAERGLSCVGCHMQALERPIANAPSGSPEKAYEKRAGRSHALQTPRDPAFLRLAFGLSAKVDGGKTVVTVANQAGHRVPGLIGRTLKFQAEALDASGKVIAKAELEIDHRSYLPVDDRLELVLDKPAASVHILGLHDDPRAAKRVTFCDEKLTPTAK